MNARQLILAGAIGIIAIMVAATYFLATDTDSEPSEPEIPHVGLLLPYLESETLIKTAMARQGYIEGETITYTTATGLTITEMRQQGQFLLDQDIDILIVLGGDIATVVAELTEDIPIIFMGSEGSYASQVLAKMETQGADTNITGVLTTDFTERRFDLLMEVDPTIETIFVPYEQDNLVALTFLQSLDNMAAERQVELIKEPFITTEDIDQLLSNIPPDTDAIFLGSERQALNALFQWADAAMQHGAILSIPFGEVFSPQVLMGYGTSFDAAFNQAARMSSRILEGAKPADIPIEYTELRLVISLGAARAIGLEIPNSVLEQASEILRQDVEIEETAQPIDFSSACNAQLSSVLGISDVCVQASCNALVDSSLIQYSNKVIVDSCSQQGAIGTCTAQGAVMYFYTGDPSALESGCQLSDGTWDLTESSANESIEES